MSIFALVIDLARHLEVLLLSNDCVAVPDFGGFVAHYVAARIDETDGMFLPPMRTIGFNPQLKMNDSLLAQSYIEANDISYPEALRTIEQEVDEIRQHIMHEGTYHLEGIGTLIANGEGGYCFTPCESGLLTPALYGLNAYEFIPLKPFSSTPKSIEKLEPDKTDVLVEEEETLQQPLIELVEDTDEENDEEHAIRIKMSWIRNTVAIAAAVVMFFLLTTPVANSDMGSQTMSALRNTVFSKLIPQDSNMMPATPVIPSKSENVAKDQSQAEQKKDTIQQVSSAIDAPYCLVLASQVRRDNAEMFAQKMRDRGFKDTELYIHNNIVRVVYGHFKSENDAYGALHHLRFEEDFEEAWVYKRKDEA